MPAIILNELGTVTLSDDLIAIIAGTAAVENYGIVAMNSKSATDAILQLVGSENMKRGVACLACIHACPQKAIQFTFPEKNPHARYRNPHVSLKDIIAANCQI